MGFAAEVQQSLVFLRDNPNHPPLLPRQLPREFIRELREMILGEARKGGQDYGILQVDRNFGGADQLTELLHCSYEPYRDLGIGPGENLKALLFYELFERDASGSNDALTAEQNILYTLAHNTDLQTDDKSIYRLEYLLANHLCYYRDHSWALTRLGEVVILLTELEAIRFLLALETFLCLEKPRHPYSMPFNCIKNLCDLEIVDTSIPDGIYEDAWDFEYMDRLVNFGLAKKVQVPEEWGYPDGVPAFSPTRLGKLILESVIAQDSVYDTLVQAYIREIITGFESSRFSSAADFQRLRALIAGSPLAGELRQDILDEIARLQQTESAYRSIFTALVPKIEGLLRNLCRKENVEVTGATNMNAYLTALKKPGVNILKLSTLEFLDGIVRPFRNIIEHGHSLPEEPARLMCQLTLNAIEQIHQDYDEYLKTKNKA